MVIEKIINNNIISSKDESGIELIVMGRGIGYAARSGACIDENKIEKIFRIEERRNAERLKHVLSDVPFRYAEIADDVIRYAKEKITVKLNENIYITLTEHLSFVFKRYQEGIRFENPLLWEIKRFYPLEYEIGEYAIELIRDKTGVDLMKDEAGFIALHFVNSEYGTDLDKAGKFPIYIDRILCIIQDAFDLTFDETSLRYERLMTHVKFLIQRVLQNELNSEDDKAIIEAIQKQYVKEYACCEMISEYIKNETGIELPDAEKAYMAIHIHHMGG